MYVGLVYFWIALIGGLCWNRHIADADADYIWPITMRMWTRPQEDRIWTSVVFPYVDLITNILFIFSVWSRFPIYFWPLLREVEELLAFADHPACEAQLPWATTWVARRRSVMKAALGALVISPPCFMLSQKQAWHCFEAFANMVPFPFATVLLPSIMAFVATWTHWQNETFREARVATVARLRRDPKRPDAALWPSSKPEVYLCGRFGCHLVCTAALVFLFLVLLFAMFALWMCDPQWAPPWLETCDWVADYITPAPSNSSKPITSPQNRRRRVSHRR